MTYTFKIARRLASNHRRLLGLLALATLAGCGAEPNVVISEQPGAVTVTINGLAGGAAPQVTLRGPDGYQKSITHSGTVTGLAFGSYELVAGPSTTPLGTFSPTVERQAISLRSDAPTATTAIQYTIATGALDVRIEGLPASTASAALVAGPQGFSLEVSGSTMLRGLAPGSYTVYAAPRYTASGTFYPASQLATTNVAASLTPASATVTFRRVHGVLSVEFAGLPAGVNGDVELTGPGNYNANLASAVEIPSISPGPYLLVARPIEHEGHRWAPVATATPVTVDTGRTRVEVEYRIVTGALAVEVMGLPDGVQAAYEVHGPDGFARTGSDDATYVGIETGTYTLTVAAVRDNDREFKPKKTSQSLPVGPGRSPKRGQIEYTETAGTLDLTVSGLSNGVPARVIVTGPGTVDTMSASGSLNGLAAGSYTVTAEDVSTEDATWVPSPSSQAVSVAADGSTPAAVNYARTTGVLQVSITGLAGGAAAAVVVTGPAGFSRTLTAGGQLGQLAPGSYVISAQSVTLSGVTYQPTPGSRTVSVTAGASTSAAVAYATATPTVGSLAISVGGLPTGSPGLIGVTGPNGFQQTLTGTATLSGLAPGNYSVTAHAVSLGGTSYQPSPASRTIAVTAGATAGHAVSYVPEVPATGTLIVAVSGLPGGASAAIRVTHTSGFDQAVTATDTLAALLVPATYTVQAQSVTVGGTTYAPAQASQTAYLTAGATLTRTVSYAANSTPQTGALALAVSGLPSGTGAAITVSGPNGFTQTVTGSTTLSALATGTYTITAAQVSAGGTAYAPTPLSQSASITGGTTTNRSVAYAAQGGTGGPATVTVDTTTQHQVMAGWEATAQGGQEASGFLSWQQALMDQAANDLGINRLRIEVRAGAENPTDWYAAWKNGSITTSTWNANRYATVNDNGNAGSLNMAGFHFTELDEKMNLVAMPLRQRLASRGERLYLNLTYVGFTTASGYVHDDPAEYAELMLATFIHLRDTFGVTPDAIEVILEPDNGTHWTGTLIGQAIVAAGDRLAAAGFHPEFIGPSVMYMSRAVPHLDAMVAVPRVLDYLREVSYHRYGGVSDANLTAIRGRAAQYGLRTSMLEHMGSGVEDLYKDLTLANASAWQQFALAYPTADNGAQYYTISGSTPVMGSRTRLLRQYFRYVREGARRVAATSTSNGVRPVAFTNPGGGMAVVLHIDAAGSYTVSGIRPGSYGAEFTSSSGARTQLPNVTATSGATVTVAPTQTGVLTLYRLP